MQASPEFRPAAVSADAPADGRWRRQTDNHGHGRALVPPDAITGAPETAVTVLRERAEVSEQRADDAVTMAEYLRINHRFVDGTMTGGSTFEFHVQHGAAAIREGLCDTITVLARGAVLAEGTYPQVSNNPAVLEAYVGTTDE